YWISSAASELVVTPSGRIGSVGVVAIYPDTSALEGKDGVTHKIFSAGKFKAEANPYRPLSDEAGAHMQAEVDRYYEMFVADLARHRSVTAAKVKNGFGQGRMVGAQDAVQLGMADRVATLEETIQRLSRSAGKTSVFGAEVERKKRFYAGTEESAASRLSAADQARARYYN
ncbi:MAG: S49 family peptidase, partial [Candidatus Binatia bacterium]